ncbi:MAG: hypothetical protein Q7U78_10935 [Gallionella sp.]|nr:hypothetical protein [Gallionella sp.]
MMRLEKALRAWGTSDFEEVLKRELSQLPMGSLPLQQGLTVGNYVADTPISAMISSVVDLQDVIRVRAGIFYQGVIGGCSCTDDPTPVSEINEYCEVQLDIDKTSAATAVTLIE